MPDPAACAPAFDVVESAPHAPPPTVELLMRWKPAAMPNGPFRYCSAALHVEPALKLPATPPSEYEPLAVRPYRLGDVYTSELLARYSVSSESISPGCAPYAPVNQVVGLYGESSV